ncbi:caspase family protein [Streptomyces violaceus]|uniref:caspase family protein n=1 Tax=Streptomyces violaceus TaxID=1936 RepID=UPI0035F36C1F
MEARRLLLATAITRYPSAPELDREELVEDVGRMRTLLCDDFGYEYLPILPVDPTGEQLRSTLRDFAVASDRHDEDFVLLYLTGHGDVLDSGRHILLPSDHKPDDVLGRGVKTSDLAGWMLEQTRIKRLMIILDCCYAGQGGKELAAEALSNWNGQGSLVVVTATRPHQQALPGVFTQAFSRAVRNEDRAVGGFAAPALSVRSILDRIRHDVQVPGTQIPVPVQLGSGPDLDFLPNPHYSPQLVDLDIETQERLYQQQHEHLENRFLPATQWFTGRQEVLRALTAWLGHDVGQRLLVVTGHPGSGKTAVLGLIAALSDPDRRPGVPRRGLPEHLPSAGAIDAAVYAGTMTTPEVLAAIGAAAAIRVDPGVDESEQLRRLVAAIRGRSRVRKSLTVLVDALDEAAEPQKLARCLGHLLHLLEDDGGLRILLGARRPLLEHLKMPADVIDLDDSTYSDCDSVRAYTRTLLLQSRVDSPYRQVSESLLQAVAGAVATAAGPSFLVARILAQSLAAAAEPADPTDETWRRSLQGTAGAAMRRDLENRLGDQADRAGELLLPLAYARGVGLPREEAIWARLADALHPGRHTTEADLTWLRRQAGSYFKESDGSLYRLFHQTLAEDLLQGRDAVADHAAISQALVSCVPPAAEQRRHWPSAHPYIHAHLATHAAQGHQLDSLLTDPDYLLSATPTPLLAVLRHADTDAAISAAGAYRSAAHHLFGKPNSQHASYLELAARCGGASHLADAIAARYPHRPWSTRWALWKHTQPHLILTGHKGPVRAVAMAELDGHPVIVSASDDRTLRVWDLATGTLLRKPFTGHKGPVRAVAAAELDGHPVIVSASHDETVRVWDLASGREIYAPDTGHAASVSAVAVAELDGRPVALSGSFSKVRILGLDPDTHDGGRVARRNWLYPRRQGRRRFAFTMGYKMAMAVGELNGRPVAITGDIWGLLEIRDVATGALTREPFQGHCGSAGRPAAVEALAAAQVAGRFVVASSGEGDDVCAWDLNTGTLIGTPFMGHRGIAHAVAVADVDGLPVVVSAGDDQTVRIWEPGQWKDLRRPMASDGGRQNAVAVGELDGQSVIVSVFRGVHARDLATGDPVGRDFTGTSLFMYGVAVGQLDGRPVAVTAGSRAVEVSDLATGTAVGAPFTGHRGSVFAVAVAELDGRSVVVSAGKDRTVRVSDLATGAPSGEPFTAHKGSVHAVAVDELDGRPIVVSVGSRRDVWVWDLATRRPLAHLKTSSGGIGKALVVSLSTNPRFVQAGESRWDLVQPASVQDRWWRKKPLKLKFRPVRQEPHSHDAGRAVMALMNQPGRARVVVRHETAVEIEDVPGRSQVIELDAKVLHLATAAPHMVVAATTQGIVVLNVP